jgi:hypothetical protein
MLLAAVTATLEIKRREKKKVKETRSKELFFMNDDENDNQKSLDRLGTSLLKFFEPPLAHNFYFCIESCSSLLYAYKLPPFGHRHHKPN